MLKLVIGVGGPSDGGGVRHALDWIAEHGRFLRTLGAERLRKELYRAKGRCTWCDGELPKGRRCWCSEECLAAFNERCWPQYVGRRIEERDKGICALCGIDVKEADELLKQIKANVGAACLRHPDNRRLLFARQNALGPIPRYGKAANAAYWKRHSRLCDCIACVLRREHPAGWEADHITPVIEGGGLCGLDGYRTLCIACHRSETAKLAARLRVKRRPQASLVEM
jgi:5-methylcytosine-specific restriction enzyme A